MGPPPRTILIFLCLLALAPTVVGAPVFIYRQITGSRVDRLDISQETRNGGEVLGVSATSGETYRIESDETGGVTACRFEFPAQRTSWTASRQGAKLRVEGTVQGRAVSRTFAIDGHPWYESAERSLQSLALSGSLEPQQFWMVEPYGGDAYLMSGRIERRERVTVDGSSVEAVRVIVRPAGLFSFIWSSTYWFSPTDGTFLRSESIRGILPLVPLTVIELMEDRRAR